MALFRCKLIDVGPKLRITFSGKNIDQSVKSFRWESGFESIHQFTFVFQIIINLFTAFEIRFHKFHQLSNFVCFRISTTDMPIEFVL